MNVKFMKRLSCMDCGCSAMDAETGIWMCMADPNWPAPCEYEEEDEE